MAAAPFRVVFLRDRFVTKDDPDFARVSLFDRGYLLGEGVFATMRAYAGACFRAERHLRSLADGAAAFGMRLPMSVARLGEIADEAARLTGEADAYVRVTLTHGDGTEGPVTSVVARASEVPSDEDYAGGVPVCMVAPRRIPPECLDQTFKTTSYAPAVLARREAVTRGVFEGLQLAIDGSLACATMANIFLVEGNVLRTPSLASGCRAGITREAILTVAAAHGIDAREEKIELARLFSADEVFLTSTRIECLPVASVDGRPVGHRPISSASCTGVLRGELRRLIEDDTRARTQGGRT